LYFCFVQRTIFYYAANKRYIKQGLQTFLSEGRINYYTKVRGPNILRIGIVSGCITFYQIKKFFVN